SQLKSTIGRLSGRAKNYAASASEIKLRVDNVDVIGPARRQVRAQVKPRRDDLIQLNIPSQILRDEARACRSSSEIERLNWRSVNEHVEEVGAINFSHAVCGVARHSARRIAREAAKVQRNFVVEESYAAAKDRSVAFKRRPCEACARRQVHLIGDALILVAQTKIETKIRAHEQPILREPNILSIIGFNQSRRSKDNALGQCSVLTQDVHGARSVS